MEFPIKFDTAKAGWSIVYIEESHVIIFKNILNFFFWISIFLLAHSADPVEMQRYAAFYLGLHCMPKYPFIMVWSSKG